MANVIIKSYVKQREKEISERLEKAMAKVGAVVERQAKINVSQSPPSHPQVDTGRLRSSIIHRLERDGNEISAIIGSNVYYGKYLEFGTINHPPYPWLFPSVEVNRQKIIDILKGAGGELASAD